MQLHFLSLRVYYEDTDFSGAVYHAAYLRFLERGRTEFLRTLGLDQGAAMAADGFGFAVRALSIEFLKPARMDDVLSVETQAPQVGGASLVLRQRVLRAQVVLASAQVKVAALRHGRATRLPPELRARLGG